MLLRNPPQAPERVAAVERLKDWTRARFNLGLDAPILVAEVACGLPGCPPLETVVAFWTDDGRRHQFKLFTPATEVVEADLPPYWMRPALAASEDSDLQCC
ncbi:MAG: hypothetical protein ACJ8F3_19525 [Xanthobacteraceae bacterium]